MVRRRPDIGKVAELAFSEGDYASGFRWIAFAYSGSTDYARIIVGGKRYTVPAAVVDYDRLYRAQASKPLAQHRRFFDPNEGVIGWPGRETK
jgi:hypothetical protein